MQVMCQRHFCYVAMAIFYFYPLTISQGILFIRHSLFLEDYMSTAKKHEFKAEVRKVLDIITHSLYTNREIFLRELISNASDALDKLRFQQNKGQNPLNADLPLEITITTDKDAKTLTICDTGIGMTEAELINNLGTIAKSGSEEFLADINANKDGAEGSDASNIIGRFGVGFYAVFMVANKVEVTSCPAFEEGTANTWSSDGSGTFSVDPSNDAPLRGTRIVAHLKDDAVDFLEKYRLESIIRKHSAFIPFNITVDGEHINTTPALWREPKFSITKEQYSEFYKFLTYDSKDPLDTIHLSVDAPVQFNALLFIPENSHDFFSSNRERWGLDLYARRVLIMRENKELLPEYLAFFKGVVDTEDLPLNISRETLQENVVLRKIQQTIVKQSLSHLEKLSADSEAYAKFWHTHGKVLKLGYHDFINREKVTSLLRFNSSLHEDAEGLTSLDEYMERAKPLQKTFWYVAGASREAVRLNPHLEVFRKKGLEVLYLTEPIDEFVMEGLGQYKEWDFKAVEHANDENLKDFANTEDEQAKSAPLADDDVQNFDALLKDMQNILGEKVKEVRISPRLGDSPACLVAPDGGMTSSMEKLMRVMNKDDSVPQKIFEVNRDHPMLRTLLRIHKSDASDPLLKEMVEGLYDTSLLLDGYVKDPHALASRTNKLMEQAGAWYAELKKM